MKRYSADNIRNVALVGHNGVGKTTLAEHMLFIAGASDRIGTVDAGNTVSDFDTHEIKRKISLNLSVLPLEWKDCKINLIDVPGFPDFIGELYSTARIVDAMIIVTPAQRDLDVGFENAWELAEKYGIPRFIYVNKMERDNADYNGLMETLRSRYGRLIVPLELPLGNQTSFHGIVDLVEMVALDGGDKEANLGPIPGDVASQADILRAEVMDSAAEGDDDLALKYLEGEELTAAEVMHGLKAGVVNQKIAPLHIGSAIKGVGITTLMDTIVALAPSPAERPAINAVNSKGQEVELTADAAGPLAAFVFKTTADPYVGKITYFKVVSGTVKSDTTVYNTLKERDERLGQVSFPRGKNFDATSEVPAGDIAVVAKLQETSTSDTLCEKAKSLTIPAIEFPNPIYTLSVAPASKPDEDKLGPAIQRLVEEDPTFRSYRDPVLHQTIISGMGDTHLDVVIERLKSKFGVNVVIEEAKVAYRETIKGIAKSQGKFKRQTGGRGQFGDCWLRLEPLERGAGFEFADEVVGGSIPRNFIPAVEKGVREILETGFLAGYPVADVKAVVVDGSYHDVDSSEHAFKQAGKMAFDAAAKKASPTLIEPVMLLDVIVPEVFLGDVISDLNGRRGRPLGMESIGGGRQRVRANVPQSEMMKYALDLRSLTRGRGRFSTEFSHYEEVPAHVAQGLIDKYIKERKEEEG
ncbi:MAG: elongation factor G [bacterium]